MWNPFSKTTKASLCQSAPIQIHIISAMEGILNALDTEVLPEPREQTLPVPKDVQALIDAGFTNHKKVQAFREKQEALKDDFKAKYKAYREQSTRRSTLKSALRTLIKARRVYGSEVLLMPIDQFMQVCNKYNLVWGTFDQYTGDIPEEKLQEIIRIQNIDPIHDSAVKITEIIKTGNGSSNSIREYQEFDEHFNKKFPIVRYCSGAYTYTVDFLDRHRSQFYNMRFKSWSYYYFIAAPEDMMSGKIKETYAPKDPIIWGISGNYALIFTRWGEEASDEVIRRYEAFNRRLDAFVKSFRK